MTNHPPSLYISGPIRGKKSGNRPAFAKAVTYLDSLGYASINPHDLQDKPTDKPDTKSPLDIRIIMLHDIMVLATQCHGIFMLPGWEKSSGALAEYWFARSINMPIWGENWYDLHNRKRFRCNLDGSLPIESLEKSNSYSVNNRSRARHVQKRPLQHFSGYYR